MSSEIQLAKFSPIPATDKDAQHHDQNDQHSNTHDHDHDHDHDHASVEKFRLFNVKANRRIFNELTACHARDVRRIAQLTKLLQDHGIPIPEFEAVEEKKPLLAPVKAEVLEDTSTEAFTKFLSERKDKLGAVLPMSIQYKDLGFWVSVPAKVVDGTSIPTVGSTFHDLFFGSGPRKRVDILKNISGSVSPGKMTLVMGPPGCGKTTFLKALAGQLHRCKDARGGLVGSLTYNDADPAAEGVLVGKMVDYVDEVDVHSAVLTVRETMEFAWRATTGGQHMYGLKPFEETAQQRQEYNAAMLKVQNIINLLGLSECADTVVGNDMLKGISGGQKRRVTLGEMLVCPRSVKILDAISNGLDAATTLDINRSLKVAAAILNTTIVTSLLQPSPEVFGLFDDLVLLSQGQLLYHGPRDKVLGYLKDLGYECLPEVDVADFLQELCTPEGRRFIVPSRRPAAGGAADGALPVAPVGTAQLAKAWLESPMNPRNAGEAAASAAASATSTSAAAVVPNSTSGAPDPASDPASAPASSSGKVDWPVVFKERWATHWPYYGLLVLQRQLKITRRDMAFVRGRIMQVAIIGSIAGSLFNNIPTSDVQTMGGMLFFCSLFCALSGMSLLAPVMEQRKIFYKHSRGLFYPASSFAFAQTAVLVPLQMVEACLFCSITYWSVGLSADNNGGRFFTHVAVVFSFALCVTQYFRMLGNVMPSLTVAQPLCGVSVVLMVLFSGYIIPESEIPDGWLWFYYINPLAWALRSVTVNEFLASDYDSIVPCVNPPSCTESARFGTLVLETRGNPTDQRAVWVGFMVLIGEFLFFWVCTTLILAYVRSEPTPLPPKWEEEEEAAMAADSSANLLSDESAAAPPSAEMPSFQPVSLAFRDIWYTVTLKGRGGEELDLLKGVSGAFEPGTMTALMGSSGAGKTTLLDVLADRKNTGTIRGRVYLNGEEKTGAEAQHAYKQRIMGYVEQFDSLSPRDTAREAVEFSAALRLSRETSAATRAKWVEHLLDVLELTPVQDMLIGDLGGAGMSFEQRKRISIAVELAANPAVIFLDEPTSGLDSRAAQVVIRCIRRVASSGRTVVCTIHQPSISIFSAFDQLLLLRRGGQVVFNGELNSDEKDRSGDKLVSYFEAIPGVPKMVHGQNPATWMLEVIGAGTGGRKASSGGGKGGGSSSQAQAVPTVTDYHQYYLHSALAQANRIRLDALCADDDASTDPSSPGSPPVVGDDHHCKLLPIFRERLDRLKPCKMGASGGCEANGTTKYRATYFMQAYMLSKRATLSYWRSPSYNFARMLISVVVALLFSSAYVNQQYSTDVEVVSRSAVIYITTLFTGVIGMMSVQPVAFSERPAFYREKQTEMYSVLLYSFANSVVELPYLIASSLMFTLPFFFIVGFDDVGDVTEKFFFYWLFEALYMATLVFMGQLLAASMPNTATAGVVGGMMSTVLSLFCGFMIRADEFPEFWTFLYWLNPLHYALEGLNMTQFHGDSTVITVTTTGTQMTAEAYITDVLYMGDWSYTHRGFDVLALLLFVVGLRVATYLSLEHLNYKQN